MTVRLVSIEGNGQRLDGGAMFGNAPRALWSRWCPPDDQNRIRLACRSFLVETGGRRILLEAGIGLCFPPLLRERYGVEGGRHVLLDRLAALGVPVDGIDVVVLSHLHFDHAGGLLAPAAEGEAPSLLFPRATYVVGAGAWGRALAPHPRDRASFLPELNALLAASGRLEVVSGAESAACGPRFRFRTSDGHTPGLLHAVVQGDTARAVFASDLVPGSPWVHLPITMGYDRFPERLIEEKEELYASLRPGKDLLLYTHDERIAASTVARDPDGRYRPSGEIEELDGEV